MFAKDKVVPNYVIRISVQYIEYPTSKYTQSLTQHKKSYQMSAADRPKISPAILALAANEVKSGAKLLTTAKKYNISRNTLRYHVINPAPRQRVGAKCVLPQQDELAIANWLKECANRKGHTLTKNEIAKLFRQAVPGIGGNENVFCGSVNVSEDSVEVVLGKTEDVPSGGGESAEVNGEEFSTDEEENQREDGSEHWSWNGENSSLQPDSENLNDTQIDNDQNASQCDDDMMSNSASMDSSASAELSLDQSGPVTFLETPKGKPCALHGGHRYLFTKKNCFDVIFWRCERYSKEKCKGSLATSGNRVIKTGPHICTFDPSRTEIITALDRCRRRVREEVHLPISRIVGEEFTPLRDRGVENVPTYLSLKSSLHRERQKAVASRPDPGDFLSIEANEVVQHNERNYDKEDFEKTDTKLLGNDNFEISIGDRCKHVFTKPPCRMRNMELETGTTRALHEHVININTRMFDVTAAL
ncbi:hypothetical protein WDU94_011515 [Cyamophila willieti]